MLEAHKTKLSMQQLHEAQTKDSVAQNTKLLQTQAINKQIRQQLQEQLDEIKTMRERAKVQEQALEQTQTASNDKINQLHAALKACAAKNA